jgi:hypothetical protein
MELHGILSLHGYRQTEQKKIKENMECQKAIKTMEKNKVR